MDIQNESHWSYEDSKDEFSNWLSKDFVTNELGTALNKCQILIIPELGFRDYDKPLFPQGTADLLTYLRNHLPEDVVVDVCIGDNDFSELLLHDKFHRIGKFVIKSIVLSLFLTILGAYIYDQISKNDEDSSISFTLTIEQEDGTGKRFSFEGEAREFKRIAEEIQKLWDEEK